MYVKGEEGIVVKADQQLTGCEGEKIPDSVDVGREVKKRGNEDVAMADRQHADRGAAPEGIEHGQGDQDPSGNDPQQILDGSEGKEVTLQLLCISDQLSSTKGKWVVA